MINVNKINKKKEVLFTIVTDKLLNMCEKRRAALLFKLFIFFNYPLVII